MPLIYHPKTSLSIADTAVQTVNLLGLEGQAASLQKSSCGAHQSKVLQHKEEREHFIAFGFQNSAKVQLSFAHPMKTSSSCSGAHNERDNTPFPVLSILSFNLPLNHMINIILGVIL